MARGRTVGKTGHRFASYLRRCGLAAAALFCIAGFAAPGLGRRRSGQGHARGHRQRRLCPPRLRHERIRRRQRAPRQQCADHHLQAPDRCRRSTASRRKFPIMSARRGAIPTARAFAWRWRSRSRSMPRRPPRNFSSICCRRHGAGSRPACRRRSSPTWRAAPARRIVSNAKSARPSRSSARRRAGARACGDAADLHPLHLRHTGQYLGVRRSRQGAADADVRRADQIRPCRCRGGAAARHRRHRYRNARRHRAGAVQFPGQASTSAPSATTAVMCSTSSAPITSRTSAARRPRRAGHAAAKRGARDHRAGNSAAGNIRGGRTTLPTPWRRGGRPAVTMEKPKIAPPATIAAPEQPAAPSTPPAAAAQAAPRSIAGRSHRRRSRKCEAQIAAPATPPQPSAFSRHGKGSAPRRRRQRQHRRQRNAMQRPCLTKLPANDAPPPRPRAADTQQQGRRRAHPPGRQPETVVSVHDADGGGGVQSRRHAVDRVRFPCRHRSQRARRRSKPHHPRRRIHPRARRRYHPHQARSSASGLRRYRRRGLDGADRRFRHRHRRARSPSPAT